MILPAFHYPHAPPPYMNKPTLDMEKGKARNFQCWVFRYFYQEPPVPVLKNKLELSQLQFHTCMELGRQFQVQFFENIQVWFHFWKPDLVLSNPVRQQVFHLLRFHLFKYHNTLVCWYKKLFMILKVIVSNNHFFNFHLCDGLN